MRERRANYDILAESLLIKFTSVDVLTNILTINHNMDILYPIVVVFDNANKQIIPDEVTVVDENRVTLDLTTFSPITGNWFVRIMG
jgi:hypothetical protein